MRRPLALPGFAVALALALAGCGGSHSTAPVVKARQLPVGTPVNSAPDSTVLRLFIAYAAMVEPAYDSLLTSDFHYHFSTQTDPTLVTQYGNAWGKFDETTSYHHQLHGFTNSMGSYVSGITNITGNLDTTLVTADPAHGDSAAWYARVDVPVMQLDLEVLTSDGGTTYNLMAHFAFLVVRGDAAVLSPGQDHSPTRWYVRECDDLSTNVAFAKRTPSTEIPLPAQPVTWGAIRAQYR